MLRPPAGAQQPVLVVSDVSDSHTLSGHAVAMTYGTLPRAARRAPPTSSASTAPRSGSSPAPPLTPHAFYGTLSHCHQPPTRSTAQQSAAQPLRLDVPPESDWRRDGGERPAPSSTHSWQPPPPTMSQRHAHLCSLCQRLPAGPLRPHCLSCSTRFHQVT